MAVKLGIITIGGMIAISCDTDPSISGGLVAPVGSFASAEDGSGFYYKATVSDTGWNIISAALDSKADKVVTISKKTANHVFVLTDGGKHIPMDLAVPNTVTIPLNANVALPLDVEILVSQYGVGQTQILKEVGVTINSIGNADKILAQGGAVCMKQIAIDEWDLWGALEQLRSVPRVYSTTTLTTLTPEKDDYDEFALTALITALVIANHSTSVMSNGDKIFINIYTASAQNLTYGTNYVARAGISLPPATFAGKITMMGFRWDSSLSKFNLIAFNQET